MASCPECGKEYDGSGMAAHRRLAHGVKGPLTKCPVCNKAVAVSYMRPHTKKYHSNGQVVPVPKVSKDREGREVASTRRHLPARIDKVTIPSELTMTVTVLPIILVETGDGRRWMMTEMGE